jgi:hypothetical protein
VIEQIILPAIITALLTIIAYLLKRTINHLESTIKAFDAQLKVLSEHRSQDGISLALLNRSIEDLGKWQTEMRDLNHELKGQIKSISDLALCIPEMKKDLDAAHFLIRDLRGKLNFLRLRCQELAPEVNWDYPQDS